MSNTDPRFSALTFFGFVVASALLIVCVVLLVEGARVFGITQ